LTAALDRDGVVAAMLIGSQARGEVGPLSDVDIAVWHEPDLDPSLRLRLQLDLIEAAEGALGTALCGGRIDEGTFGRRPAR
jgi:predicted nucleotidyltransferase